jgi:hypothetical protein
VAAGSLKQADGAPAAGTPVRLLTLGSLNPFYSMTRALTGKDPAYPEEMAALVAATT